MGRPWVARGGYSATRSGVVTGGGCTGMSECVCETECIYNRIVKCTEDNTVLSSREGNYIHMC